MGLGARGKGQGAWGWARVQGGYVLFAYDASLCKSPGYITARKLFLRSRSACITRTGSVSPVYACTAGSLPDARRATCKRAP